MPPHLKVLLLYLVKYLAHFLLNSHVRGYVGALECLTSVLLMND